MSKLNDLSIQLIARTNAFDTDYEILLPLDRPRLMVGRSGFLLPGVSP